MARTIDNPVHAEAERLIRLARGMLSLPSDRLVIAHLDLAVDAIRDNGAQQAGHASSTTAA